MTAAKESDLAFQTLLSVRDTVAPDLDPELLRQCYEMQKKYQFSEDRAISATAMERLIDAVVTRTAAED